MTTAPSVANLAASSHPGWVPAGHHGREAYALWHRASARRIAAAARRLGLLDNMPEPYQRVFEARMPENGGPPTATLKELATELGLSPERIRQIENSETRRIAYILAGWSMQEIGLGVARCPLKQCTEAVP